MRAFQGKAEDVDRALDEVTARDRRCTRVTGAAQRLLWPGWSVPFSPRGLPGRPWFKHAIYAPGVTTGYGAWPLPAIRQALENHKPEQLGPLVAQTVEALNAATAELGKVLEAARSATATVVHAR